MQLDKSWSVLTVGDGDLSFSLSILENGFVDHVTPTVFDSEQTLRKKYRENAVDELARKNAIVTFEFDVTNEAHWQKKLNRKFDAVIFQFPLVPAIGSECSFRTGPSVNIRNRDLVFHFLNFASQYALKDDKESLIYLTTKDVKPYIDWNIESLSMGTKLVYQGCTPFNLAQFKGYDLRNVDRDKYVKDTASFTYVWSLNEKHLISGSLVGLANLEKSGCTLCKAGPFSTTSERKHHENSKRHNRMVKYEQEWFEYNSKVTQHNRKPSI